MTKKDLVELWLPHIYAIPMELLFMFKLEESIEEWETRRDHYIKLILSFKKLALKHHLLLYYIFVSQTWILEWDTSLQNPFLYFPFEFFQPFFINYFGLMRFFPSSNCYR